MGTLENGGILKKQGFHLQRIVDLFAAYDAIQILRIRGAWCFHDTLVY